MKYLKHFEQIPKIGDYAIANTKSNDKEFISFVNNNIGTIVAINNDIVTIKYNNISKNLLDFFQNVEKNSGVRPCIIGLLKYFSHNKKELELKLASNKYNI